MSSGLKLYYRALLLVLMGLFLWGYNPSPAQAACASPSGVAGELLYDDGDSVMTYCDGTNWIEFPKVAAGGGSGTPSAVSVGQYHSCALMSNGTAWCWGDNTYGELGDGTTTYAYTPVQVGTSGTSTLWSDWTYIHAGYGTTCGIRSNGTAWCWGEDTYGKLGNGSAGASTTPVQVGTSGTSTLFSDWTLIESGRRVACGIRSGGTAWCWGDNAWGQLGNNNAPTDEVVPVQVGTVGTSTLWSDWTDISVGLDYLVCGVRSGGTAWCWGYGSRGERGDGTTTSSQPYPSRVGTAGTSTLWSDWTDIEAGYIAACGLRSGGTAWCWGAAGMRGDGVLVTGADESTPQQVGTSGTSTLWSDWTDISALNNGTCGLRSNGTIWCWGAEGFYPGNNSVEGYTIVPTQTGTSATSTLWSDWSDVSRGKSACGIRNSEIWCWGTGGLGAGLWQVSAVPLKVGTDYPASLTSVGGFTYKNTSSPETVSSSISVSAGDRLIVCAATLGTVTDIKWQATQSFTLEASDTSGSVNIYLYSYDITSSGTGSIYAYLSGTDPAATAAYKLIGTTATTPDKTATASGSSSTPSSGLTATTSQADELVFGCLGVNGPVEDAAGEWSNGMVEVYRKGTTGQGATSNLTFVTGWYPVQATGTYEAARTGMQSRNWTALVATFKASAGPTEVSYGGGGGSGCSSPTGIAGMMLYDTGDDVMTYCNGSAWVEAGPNPGNGGAGCSSPSGTAGSMIYDNGDSVLTYCDGANWVKIGK